MEWPGTVRLAALSIVLLVVSTEPGLGGGASRSLRSVSVAY